MIACIPTKSRYNTKTYKLFEVANIPYLHFIEPAQYDDYDVPNKVNIQQNNQGISYVRNFILEYAKLNNIEWVIMCDDDVTEFGYAQNNKCIISDATIWNKVMEKAVKLPFNIYGLNYRQHAWHEKKEYSINKSFVEVCVLINVKSIDWKYRHEFNLKEDRDFILQCIKYGQGCVKFLKLFYNCPGVGKNVGGLNDDYKQKKDHDAAKKLAYEWRPHIQIINKNDRIEAKVDIQNIAKKYKKVVI